MRSSGTVYQRCGCRDPLSKRQLGSRCPLLGQDEHGSWYVTLPGDVAVGKGQDRLRRGGYPGRAQAEAVLALLLDPALSSQGRGLTVGQWLERWLEDVQPRLRPTTVRGYRKHVEQYLVPLLGGALLCELSVGRVQQAFGAIIARHEADGQALSGATVQRIRATLRSALNAAIRAEVLQSNPARHLELPRVVPSRTVVWTDAQVAHWRRTGERPAVAVWTPQGTAAFLHAIRHHRLYALYHLYTLRGLRRGESLGLQWSDIDLKGRTLTVRRQLQKRPGGVLEECPPKTASSRRQVALDHRTTQVLAAHHRRQQAQRAEAGDRWSETGYVFTDPTGRPLNPDHVGHVFQQLVRAHDLPPIRLHDLRHVAATLALNAGVPLKVVQHQVGHDSLTTTADIYTAVLPQTAHQAAEATTRLITHAAREHHRTTRHRPRIRQKPLKIRIVRHRPPGLPR